MINLALLLINASMGLAQEDTNEKARVTVEATTILGQHIDTEVEYVALISGQEIVRGRSGRTTELRPSLYLVRIAAAGFAKRNTVIDVTGGSQRFRVGLNVADVADTGPRPSIRGQAKAAAVKAKLWVRLVPLTNQQEGVEVPVMGDGSFSAERLAPGEYALLLVANDQLLQSKQVSCYGEVKIILDIPRKPSESAPGPK